MIKLRAHHLLCLQGFKGEGYNKEFIKNMFNIYESLKNFPTQLVNVIESYDDICKLCPNLKGTKCYLNGSNFETFIQKQDRMVIAHLFYDNRRIIRWNEILFLIREKINEEILKNICGNCRWLKSGYCLEGIKNLYFIEK